MRLYTALVDWKHVQIIKKRFEKRNKADILGHLKQAFTWKKKLKKERFKKQIRMIVVWIANNLYVYSFLDTG